MTSIVDSIEASFKTLVLQKPYRSITVKEICEDAFISRRTFYANFVDKRAIVAYLVRRDVVDPVMRALDLLAPNELREMAPIVLGRSYECIRENAEFYTSLVRPMVGNDSTFELVMARAVCGSLKKLVSKHGVLDGRGEKALYYHAAGWAILVEKWIYDGYDMSADELGSLQAELLVPVLEPSMHGGSLSA